MTWEIAIVVAVTVAAIALFISERLPSDLVGGLVMAALLLTGSVSPAEGIAGFASPATVTVAAMFVLSAALSRCGAVQVIGDLLARLSHRGSLVLLLALMASAGLFSAFVNNTAVVAILIPVVLGLSNRSGRSPSRLLMPLSFASMFGGVCTLIGTSTNILADSIMQSRGLPGFGFFEFSGLGLVFFAAGLLYMATLGIHLVPMRGERNAAACGLGDYLTQIVLTDGAASIGMRVSESALVRDTDLDVIEIRRDGERIAVPAAALTLRAGDTLLVRGTIQQIAKLRGREGVQLAETRIEEAELATLETRLVEAVIGPASPLIGRTVRELRLQDQFGSTVLALRHHSKLQLDGFKDTLLRPGDVLLLCADRPVIEHLRRSKLFLILTESGQVTYRTRKMALALAIMGGVILAAALGITPIVVSAVVGAIATVVTGCLEIDEAYDAVDWRVLFLLAGMLALGAAMERSGAAAWIAHGIVEAVGELGPRALIAALYLLTAILTEAMSNNATVVLIAPIAIETAQRFGIDPRPLVLAVMFAASTSFMTPVGYQTNTMIYGPGQFRFFDFARVGAPLNLLFWGLAIVFIPWFFPT